MQPDCWSLTDEYYTVAYLNPVVAATDSSMTEETPYAANVLSTKSSIAPDKMTFPAPPGCQYTLPTDTLNKLLFNNSQLEFTSNFKEKASKQTVYKVKVEERAVDESNPVNE